MRWLVADQLGTPRMVVDRTGGLSGVRRHDYLPFGEEVASDPTWRKAGRGYAGDDVRQQFTGYERDGETGLDYAQARYFSSPQGRFTAVDPLLASGVAAAPQTWNRYSYVANNPLRYTDPSGMYLDHADHTISDQTGAPQPTPAPPPATQPQQSAIQKQVEELKQKARPLKTGEQAVPTTMVYLQGDQQTLSGQQIKLPDGTPVTQDPVHGMAQVNAVAVLDQGDNIMGPEAGLVVMETVRPASPDAQAAAAAGQIHTTNSVRIGQHTDGLFYDTVRVTDGTAAASAQRFSQPFDVQVNQRVTVSLAGSRTLLFYVNNTHRITNSGITSTIGTAQPWPRR